ncbi:MAG TPA: hypothetical protein VLT33_19265, partial [Labilithrix sp.]|nr:hypothetical protein [Labilithrix sp.]
EELRSAPGFPPALRGVALVARGIQERYQGDPRTALATHEEAARELDVLDLVRARAMNDACMGRLHCDLRDAAAARALNGRSIAASEAIGDLWLGGLALANLAQLEQEEGRLDGAETTIADAVARLERAGEVHAAAIYASVRGDLLFERGKIDAARDCYAAGARYFGSLLTHRQAGILHAAAAALEATAGDLGAASAHLEVAARSASRSGNPVVRQVVHAHRGTVEIWRAPASERPGVISTWRAWVDRCEGATPEGALAATSMDLRFALRILARAMEHGAARATRAPATLRVAHDASWFSSDGERVVLGRRAALRRILAALCEQHAKRPGQGLGVSALLEQGWPGERVLIEAAETRVRVAVSTLRRLGLRSMIVTRDDGYGLDARVTVEISPTCPP